MTQKQERIVHSALELFAEQGFNATSTAQIARVAGVSEGLIFRHFDNKQGLLEAVMEQGKQKILQKIEALEHLDEPGEVIRNALDLPFAVEESEYPFWRLYYALKWQAVEYDFSILDPLKRILSKAVDQLDADMPEAEAETVLLFIDGVATAVLLRDPKHPDYIQKTILNKYNL